MEVRIEDAGVCIRVRLYGQLDSKGAGAIYDTIVELGSLAPGRVVVNVANVPRATRAGCGVLMVAAKLLQVRIGEKLLITDASPEMVAILRGAGFDHLIVVQPRCHVLAAAAA